MARQTRHAGLVLSARLREWRQLVALAAELRQCAARAVESDCQCDSVLADYLSGIRAELEEITSLAAWLADRIWPDGTMAVYTWSLCQIGGDL